MKTKTSITLSRENLREILGEAVSKLVPGFTMEKFAVHQNGSIDVTLAPANSAELPLDAMPVSRPLGHLTADELLTLPRVTVDGDPINPLLAGAKAQ